MKIKEMFEKDIDRKINGVVQVNQDDDAVLVQELDEYVITRELKKHFVTFFNAYNDSFKEPTSDTGVWISGFFGSGKSHFLKILSYLLQNREVQGIKTVERFRSKFEKDPGTFMLIDQATKGPTDTILFNIDEEGSIDKDETAVLRVFAKMFYKYLGFYGESLKVSALEKFIDSKGKTKEFRRAFEEESGLPWVESRDTFAFYGDEVVAALQKVLGMSEVSARQWFDSSDKVDMSIAKLVDDIKKYVEKKPDNFRLLFMIDEVGQYVGEDTSLLLNLQTLVEAIGRECRGKVWVVCTGQEALDDIIRTRQDEFSRIQARFKTRLSLTSSSADEVIQKRILRKKKDAIPTLEAVYNHNDSVMKNLFTFSNALLDIKGYGNSGEFVRDFPFVPYQFLIMQKVFTEIRKHGNSGKHLSGGERSMLSGFQEAAQKIENKEEYSIAPFYLFYDTVHTFLDSSIRQVIERCDRAAEDGNGIEKQDVNLLKLLYLIRYIDDIPSNIDNLVILMADDIRVDKISLRQSVTESLGRLLSQNYIGRSGDTYNFLTDEEQDIAREIKNTPVDTAAIEQEIGKIIFDDIYSAKKKRYGNYDFSFDKVVDHIDIEKNSAGMKLRILTAAADPEDLQPLSLVTNSQNEVRVVLGDKPYYETLEQAMKITKFVKQKNVIQLPKSVQDIIRSQNDEAVKYREDAKKNLVKALEEGAFYADGEKLDGMKGDGKSRIDQAMDYLISHVYSKLDLVQEHADSDAYVAGVLQGRHPVLGELDNNRNAEAEVEDYLTLQGRRNLPTSMADLQSRFQAVPYGWKEVDIALVVARLIENQKVTIRYGGETIQPENPKLPSMLQKKSEIGKTSISIRKSVSLKDMREAREFLADYLNVMDIPKDEDGLVHFIVEKFTEKKDHYLALLQKYEDHKYPDKLVICHARDLMKKILDASKDNIALIRAVTDAEDDLEESRDAMEPVEDFFKNQADLFDRAVKLERNLDNDRDYIRRDEEANQDLDEIRRIIQIPPLSSGRKFNYREIPKLNDLMRAVENAHDRMLDEKRVNFNEIIRQCLEDIHTAAGNNRDALQVSDEADRYYTQKKEDILRASTLTTLDGFEAQMWQTRDDFMEKIHRLTAPKPVKPPVTPKPGQEEPPKKKEIIRNIPRQAMFRSTTIRNDGDIENYLNELRKRMEQLLKEGDGFRIQ